MAAAPAEPLEEQELPRPVDLTAPGLAEQGSPDGVLLLDAIRDRSGWAWRVRIKASLKAEPTLVVRSHAVFDTGTAARQAGRLLLADLLASSSEGEDGPVQEGSTSAGLSPKVPDAEDPGGL